MFLKSILSRSKQSKQIAALILFLVLWLGAGAISKASYSKITSDREPLRDRQLISVSEASYQQNNSRSSDPLGSPNPIPWEWIMQTQAEFQSQGGSKQRYYRSPSVVSPDGKYAAYSRIKMELESELFGSNVSSVMLVEDLETGDLQTIEPESIFEEGEEKQDLAGTMIILMPVSWSKTGDRLLSRNFVGFFNTADASDWAVIWDKNTKGAFTISPAEDTYTHAVLLGWSQKNPDRVLFRAGILGDEVWPVWSVQIDGQTIPANDDRAIVYE